jgi:HAD superfamily hydrolase (TIGR01509 family)
MKGDARPEARVAVAAVVFDLDGVLVDSEQVWDAARQDVVANHGGTWKDSATRDMLGMSSPEWSRYVVEELRVQLTPQEVNDAVVEAMLHQYRIELPLLPGAREAVFRMADHVPLGLASSSNREVIDLVLDHMGVTEQFMATVSSEEVERGKPAPDVYLETARRLETEPGRIAAIEDSENGIRSAHAAGMTVIAIPNPHFPPAADALALADITLPDLDALTPATLGGPPPDVPADGDGGG